MVCMIYKVFVTLMCESGDGHGRMFIVMYMLPVNGDVDGVCVCVCVCV